VAGVFAAPYVLDPLFNKFEPLAQSDPALVQQTGAGGGAGRHFDSAAADVSDEGEREVYRVDAYVTGFGASKRVVVWDTTVAAATRTRLPSFFAHENGALRAGHVALGTALTCVALLPFFWLGYQRSRVCFCGAAARPGCSVEADWGALRCWC